MPNYIWFISGILFWQLIFLIAALITNEKEEVIIPIGAGVWFGITLMIAVLYRKIRFEYLKHNYNGYRLYHNGTSSANTIYIKHKIIDDFNFDDTQEYYIKKWSDGKTWKSSPFKSDIYKNQERFHGWDMNKFKI